VDVVDDLPGDRPVAVTDPGSGIEGDGPERPTRSAPSGERRTGAAAGAPLAAALLAGAVLLVPLVVAAVVAARDGLPFVGDSAALDLRSRDVFGPGLPLVGAYSRFGWNHLGPWELWLGGIVQAALGQRRWSPVAGQLVFQAAAIVATVGIAARHGRRVLALSVVVLAVSLAAAGPRLLLDPWNPFAAYPLVPLFVVTCWLLGRGRVSAIVPAVIAGSLLVQLHIGYLPLVLAGGGWAAGRARAQLRPAARPGRPVLIAALAAGVLWAPVALDEVTRPPGNARRVTRFFLAPEAEPGLVAAPAGEPVGVAAGAGLVADAFRVPPPWAGGDAGVEPLIPRARPASPAWLVVPFVMLAVAHLRGRRTGAMAVDRLVELLAVLLVVVVVATTRLRGPPDPHMLLWRTPLALFVAAAFAAAVIPAVARERAVPVIAGVVTVVASASLARSLPAATDGLRPFRLAIAELTVQAGDRRPDGPVVVAPVGGSFGGLHAGVVDELDRRGQPVRVPAGMGYQFGDGRDEGGHGGDPAVARWYVFEGGRFAVTAAEAGAELVAFTTPLDPAAEAELRFLQRQVADTLTAVGRPDLLDELDSPLAGFTLAGVAEVPAPVRDRLAELNAEVVARGRCRCGIYAIP
jgi:hypothetical protein